MGRVLRWLGIALAAVVGLALVAGLGLGLVGWRRGARAYAAPRAVDASAVAAASVARGEHVVRTHGCQDCHGERLEGKVFLDIPPALAVASNLTRGRGGVGARYGDADWDRAIRSGVRPGGRMILPFMPYRLYGHLNDADAAALAAYLKQLPPVDNELPASKVRVPGYLMLGAMGGADLPGGAPAPRPGPADPEPTAAYGEYFASTVCIECHGERLRGGKHPSGDGPPCPELSHAGLWSEADFARAMREGVVPGGRKLTEFMPTKYFAPLTDTEVRALHAYLKTLPPPNGG
jgi:cytochrome c553